MNPQNQQCVQWSLPMASIRSKPPSPILVQWNLLVVGTRSRPPNPEPCTMQTASGKSEVPLDFKKYCMWYQRCNFFPGKEHSSAGTTITSMSKQTVQLCSLTNKQTTTKPCSDLLLKSHCQPCWPWKDFTNLTRTKSETATIAIIWHLQGQGSFDKDCDFLEKEKGNPCLIVWIVANPVPRLLNPGLCMARGPPPPLMVKLYWDLGALGIHLWEGGGDVTACSVRPPRSKTKGLWSGCRSACQHDSMTLGPILCGPNHISDDRSFGCC